MMNGLLKDEEESRGNGDVTLQKDAEYIMNRAYEQRRGLSECKQGGGLYITSGSGS